MKTTGTENQYLSDAAPARMKKKKNRLTKFLRVVILLLVILVALLSFFALALPHFRVKDVSVKGASLYTKEEIISLSEIKPGDPIMEIDLEKRAQNILAKCRYLKSISYSVRLTGSIVFEVEEETCLLYTKREDEYYSFSDSLKVLEVSDKPFDDFLYLELPEDVTANLMERKTIFVGENATFAKTSLIPLIKRLQKASFADYLTSVSLSGEHEVSFLLGDSCKVIFGEIQDLEAKEKLLEGILAKKGSLPPEKVKIDLSDPQNPIESPGN